jgi:cellulose synthase/poly-beta-1,6-N-acetylglucosamine synthase-like glycosyltransferase
VTEDADLGIRLARFGYKVRALDSDTWEEAPYELGNWFRQRVRWQKGWMQTLIVHSRRPIFLWRDLKAQRAVAAATLIVGAIFGCLFWPAFAVETIWRALAAGQGALSPWREMSDVFTYNRPLLDKALIEHNLSLADRICVAAAWPQRGSCDSRQTTEREHITRSSVDQRKV